MAVEKTLAIVGNGPSRNLYHDFGGTVCVCNVPQLDIRYDYISIVDIKAFNYIRSERLRFDRPILTTEDTHRQVAKWNLGTEILPLLPKKLMNSAATAARYFSDTHDHIYLYGCDALWSTNTKSHQDVLIPRPTRNSNLHLQWREKWRAVWKTGTKFTIVCPEGTEAIDYGQNVGWQAG